MDDDRNKTVRFDALDGCRGLAALMVALQRLQANGYHAGLGVVENAYLFVDFFFVLSGFVIAHSWRDRLVDAREGLRFVVRRIGRLWPLHVFMLALYVLVELAKYFAERRGAVTAIPAFTGGHAPETILPNLLLVHALGYWNFLTWNIPSWSISTEMWTYVVFALLCLASGRYLVAVSVIVVAVALGSVGAYSTRGMDVTFDWAFPRCVAGFFTGVVVHALWRRLERRMRPSIAAEASILEWVALAAVLAFVALAGRGVASFAAPFAFAAIVYLLAYQAGPISRLLTTRPMLAIGRWSYAIYMVNALIVVMILRAAHSLERQLGRSVFESWPIGGEAHKFLTLGPKWSMDLLAVGYLAVVLAASALLYRLIEAPGRRAFNRLADAVPAKRTLQQPFASRPRRRLLVE